MIYPTVHLNGTSKQSLLDDLEEAHWKLREAIEALAKIGPNARDYYPQGVDAYSTARAEHGARLQKLIDVRIELEQIAEHIA